MRRDEVDQDTVERAMVRAEEWTGRQGSENKGGEAENHCVEKDDGPNVEGGDDEEMKDQPQGGEGEHRGENDADMAPDTAGTNDREDADRDAGFPDQHVEVQENRGRFDAPASPRRRKGCKRRH